MPLPLNDPQRTGLRKIGSRGEKAVTLTNDEVTGVLDFYYSGAIDDVTTTEVMEAVEKARLLMNEKPPRIPKVVKRA